MALPLGAVPVILPSHLQIRYRLSPTRRASWSCPHLANYGQLPMHLEKIQSALYSTQGFPNQPGRYRSLVRSFNVKVSTEHQLLAVMSQTYCHVHILVWSSHRCYLITRCCLRRRGWDLLLNRYTRVRRLLKVNRGGRCAWDVYPKLQCWDVDEGSGRSRINAGGKYFMLWSQHSKLQGV